MAVGAALDRNAGLDGDAFARNGGDDAPRFGGETVHGKLGSLDCFLNYEVAAAARGLVERVRALDARGSDRTGSAARFEIDGKSLDVHTRIVRHRGRTGYADFLQKAGELELIAGSEKSLAWGHGETAA